MLTGNVTTTSPVTISGMVVGPAYFNYDKCKAKSTPTISVTNIDYDGVTLNGGTLANVNVEYDRFLYWKTDSSHAFLTVLRLLQLLDGFIYGSEFL